MDIPQDMTVCPNCKRKNFHLVSEERLLGQAYITLVGDPVQGFSAEWAGETEVDWNSSTILCYLCRHCDTVLPEWFQAAIDRLLGNTRERQAYKAPPPAPDAHLEAAYEDAQSGGYEE